MKITLKTLTPLWTGGVDGTSDRVHETGIIGSLRWWYESIVRGQDGCVGDPTSKKPEERFEFDSKAYQQALLEGHSKIEALPEGLKTLGAVEYLFGATGWARLFRLRSLNAPRVPLHFRTPHGPNKNWLGRIFQGDESRDHSIDNLKVVYGDITFEVSFRGHDEQYVQTQLEFLFSFIESYGGLGAKLQHGFGQISNLQLPDVASATIIDDGMKALKAKLDSTLLRSSDDTANTPYSLKHFFHQTYRLSNSVVYQFKKTSAHFGSSDKKGEDAYLPCAFDLRSKSDGNLGFRRWLKEEKGWEESDSPPPLKRLDELMGPRSQWEDPKGKPQTISDELRTASRVNFGMPIQVEDEEGYEVAIFGFSPADIIMVEDICELCEEYMKDTLNATLQEQILGKDLIVRVKEGEA